MSTKLVEALGDRLPLLASLIVICLGAAIFQTLLRGSPLSRVPFVGTEFGNAEKRRNVYLAGAKDIYRDAYKKFRGTVCRITTSRNAEIVVVSPEFLPELKKLPDDVLSFAAAVADSMETRYTKIDSDQVAISHTVKANLTPSLARLNPTIAEEVDASIKAEMPSCKEWTPVNIYSKLLRIVAIVSGRVFIGPELCHDEAYIDAAINYTLDLMTARHAIHSIPPWLRPWKAPSLPQVKKLDRRIEEADAFLRPIVTKRREAEKTPGYQKPDDMLQWLMDSQGFADKDDQEMARNQLGLSFAAIHTTCLTSTNAFYNLAAYPDMIDELRAEVKEVLAEHDGVFTGPALQNLKKMDSFLKESLRMHPPSYASFERKVLKTFVLSNGQVIPAGVTIEIPAAGVNTDDQIFSDPDKFDGLRFYRLRENAESFNKPSDRASNAKVNSSAHNQFVSVSPNSLTFGYGRHACPGRFFAANEIKMILARMVLEYDVKNVDGEHERYPNLEMANTSIPDPKRVLMFKEVR